MNNLLQTLIGFKSISSDLIANQASLEYCQQWLKKAGIKSTIYVVAQKPVLIWGTTTKNARILFNTHIDVVPGSELIFTANQEKKRLYGRGAADAKSNVALLLQLSKESSSDLIKHGVTCSIVCDEEVGGESTKKLLEHMPKLQFSIFGEPTNIRIVNQAKGIMQIKITQKGKSAHGSRPWEGINVIEQMSEALHLFKKNHPSPVKETFATTYNFSLITGGTAINQVPDYCKLLVDVRISPQDKPKKVVNELKKYFIDCSVNIIKNESIISTNKNNRWVKKFASAVNNNKARATFAFEHGSSDARHCSTLGIPAIVFGPIGGGLHQEKEWVNLASINTCKNIYKTFLKLL